MILAMSLSGTQPKLLYPPYASTVKRAPEKALIRIPPNFSDFAAPVFGYLPIGETDHDLTRQYAEEPQGQRITVSGRVMDENGRAVPQTLVEVWQTNAPGRYRHAKDDHPAPLDPNFDGSGRTMTDGEGRYHFVTIKPGAYPWRNHPNAWRPAHIHFSLFGESFLTRLVTQMYFPDDPLIPLDPVMKSVTDERARARLVSKFDIDLTQPEWALAFTWDIVLRGPQSTPFEQRT